MLELITQIPGTDMRVKTVEIRDGRFMISLQQNAERLSNPYPWEVHADGWRDCKCEFASKLADAYTIHDSYIGYELRHMMQ